MIYCWIFRFEVGIFRSGKTLEWEGPRRGRGLGMVKDGSRPGMFSGRRGAPGWKDLRDGGM